MDTLVDVLVEEDDREVTQVAKIVGLSKTMYSVTFLCPHHIGFYRYYKEPTDIDS